MNDATLNLRRKMALTTGFSLVAMAIIAGFAYGYGFQNIYVASDTEATLRNLSDSQLLFRLVILSFVLILTLDVIIGWSLYFFFKQVSEHLASLCAWLRLVGAALLGVALVNLSSVLQLSSDLPQNQALIMSSLRTFLDVWSIGLIVFSFHLFVLGYLILRAGYIPKYLGLMAYLAAALYLVSNVAQTLMQDYHLYKATVDIAISLPMAAGELCIAFWLLIKGGKVKKLPGSLDSLPDPAERLGTHTNVAG